MQIHKSKQEEKFIELTYRHPDQVCLATENADQEGFAYFCSEAYTSIPGNSGPSIRNKIKKTDRKDLPKFAKMMASCMPKMLKGIKCGFEDADYLLEQLEEDKAIVRNNHPLLETYPNMAVWKALKAYAWNKWQVRVGFTKLPEELIFKGKSVLYPYTIVCIQEMDKEAIDMAPDLEAGAEVQRIYASLGMAVNDIANWLRDRQGINCHSNHPLGGLVNTSPLAAKAGLGWKGHNGLLITPEFGQRHRIATIFIENEFFDYTDSDEHRWIEAFCENCRRCEKKCPAQAIYPEKKTNIRSVEGIGETRTCIDREKCYPYFDKTMGCSVCIKSCPFSTGGTTYAKLKKTVEKRETKAG